MLGRRRILIAEDEALIAYELALAVRDGDGEVVGPVASVQDGLKLLASEDVHAAILDVQPIDRDIAPVAVVLLERGKAIVFHCASEIPSEIVHRFGQPVLCPKPMHPDEVVARLASLIDPEPPEASGGNHPPFFALFDL